MESKDYRCNVTLLVEDVSTDVIEKIMRAGEKLEWWPDADTMWPEPTPFYLIIEDVERVEEAANAL